MTPAKFHNWTIEDREAQVVITLDCRDAYEAIHLADSMAKLLDAGKVIELQWTPEEMA